MKRSFSSFGKVTSPVRLAMLSLVLLLLACVLRSPPEASASDPGWKKATAPLVSPQEARSSAPVQALGGRSLTVGAETTITPEIQELARALGNDPKLIYEFVRNHIEYVPYYGCLKGATLTLAERSGNDFDQAALMIALLRAANHTAQFVFGTMTIPNSGGAGDYDMQHWLGIDANISIISRILGGGGIPATVYSNTTEMDRVWVQSSGYLFDPAMKPYAEISGINLESAMGYSKSEFLSAAGGEVGTDYVRNLSETGLNAKLVE